MRNAAMAVILSFGVLAIARADDTVKPPVSRMATYDKTTGEIYFALSLMVPAKANAVAEVEKADVVILFDTSASQVGLYRDDSLACLERLLEGLRDQDRVQLFALDLKPVPLNESLVSPRDPQVAEAVKKLKQRTPLGSTDMPAGILAAAAVLDNDRTAARSIIYIGDGVSRANFISADEMTQLHEATRRVRASVSSFTIGPQRNVELLATLANHSGGAVAIDSEGSDTAVLAGAGLARATRIEVLWPLEAKLDEQILVSYPEQFPPLRADRDTVLLGMLKERGEQTIEVKVVGVRGERTLSWAFTPEAANTEFGFLPKLVEMAAKDGGLRLPTVGSAGLREVGRVILNNARTMLKLGSQAIKRSDFKAALSAATAVLERDPDNPEAHALKRAAERGLRRQQAKAKAAEKAAQEKDESDKE